MGTEVELKLAASPQAMREAMQMPWLKKLGIHEPKRERLESIYFDTRDFALHKHGISLRVRKVADIHLQTIKAPSTDPISRSEWEHEIGDERPRLKLAKRTPLGRFLTQRIKRQLAPAFEVGVERTVMPLRVGNSEIELAFDRGRIITPQDHDRITEIEIELKDGTPKDVADLAKRLAERLPVRFGPLAKSDRGYALLDGTLNDAVFARPLRIPAALSSSDAFAAVGFECLRHVASNESAVRNCDPEGVHQMRVGVRRLRAAISLFKAMLNDRETRTLKGELRWVTEQLGPARDYDVLVTGSVAPLQTRHPDQHEFKVLRIELEGRRKDGFIRAKTAVASDRYRRLILNTALWLLDGGWRSDPEAIVAALRERPIEDFVENELGRRTRRIAKRLKRLEALGSRQRHKLRIAVKKMRYAREFFADLIARQHGSKAQHKFDDALKALQSSLGRLNDMTVHSRLASDFAGQSHATQKAFAIGYLTGRESLRSKELLADAAKTAKTFRKTAAL